MQRDHNHATPAYLSKQLIKYGLMALIAAALIVGVMVPGLNIAIAVAAAGVALNGLTLVWKIRKKFLGKEDYKFNANASVKIASLVVALAAAAVAIYPPLAIPMAAVGLAIVGATFAYKIAVQVGLIAKIKTAAKKLSRRILRFFRDKKNPWPQPKPQPSLQKANNKKAVNTATMQVHNSDAEILDDIIHDVPKNQQEKERQHIADVIEHHADRQPNPLEVAANAAINPGKHALQQRDEDDNDGEGSGGNEKAVVDEEGSEGDGGETAFEQPRF